MNRRLLNDSTTRRSIPPSAVCARAQIKRAALAPKLLPMLPAGRLRVVHARSAVRPAWKKRGRRTPAPCPSRRRSQTHCGAFCANSALWDQPRRTQYSSPSTRRAKTAGSYRAGQRRRVALRRAPVRHAQLRRTVRKRDEDPQFARGQQRRFDRTASRSRSNGSRFQHAPVCPRT